MMTPELQAKLNLPLPESATEEEKDEALRLLQSAIARLRINRTDVAGLNDLQSFAAGCHVRARIQTLSKRTSL